MHPAKKCPRRSCPRCATTVVEALDRYCRRCGVTLGDAPELGGDGLATRLLDTVEQAVVVTDGEGRISYWNRFAETLYGWSAAEVYGRHVLEVLPSLEDGGRAAEAMSRLRQGESWSDEILKRRRDGTVFPAWALLAPILDADQRLVGIIGISQDITARKQAEDALREARREQDRLEGIHLAAREVGHRLNNDLGVPIGVLDLLHTEPGTPAELRPLILEATAALARATEAISQLQRVARIETWETPVGPALDLYRSSR